MADLGDVAINTYSLEKSLPIITSFYQTVLAANCIPLTLARGDHTIALPILRAVAAKYGPVAMAHVDAHADVNPDMFGERIAHGTPEVGSLSVAQALEIIRGCYGLNIIGGDLVEVSPPYDTSGNTALLGANLLFEMLCVLPGVFKR